MPLALVAVTVNVYEVPSVNPVTVRGEDAPDAVILPGLLVAVYEVIAEPPVAPAVNATVADVPVFKSVAVPIVGACGTVVAVTPDEAEEAELVPKLLVAVTVYVYWVEDCKPVTVTGLEEPENVVGDVDGLGVTVYDLPAIVPAEKAIEA